MKLNGLLRVVCCLAVVFAGLLSVTLAQTTPPTTVPPITNGLPQENVAAPGSRSPGRMVSAGVAASQDAVKLVRTSSATITETEEEEDFSDIFVGQAKDIIMDQIEELVLYFANLFFERLGLPPIDLPVDNGNTNGNTNDNDNTNTNDNDNDNSNANDNDNDNSNDNANSNTNDNSNANVNANENDNSRPSNGVRKRMFTAPSYQGRK
jgi:hypothetical protein